MLYSQWTERQQSTAAPGIASRSHCQQGHTSHTSTSRVAVQLSVRGYRIRSICRAGIVRSLQSPGSENRSHNAAVGPIGAIFPPP